MRRIAALLVLVGVLGACGDGGGGGGGGGTNVTLSGDISGAITNGASIFASGPCAAGGTQVNVASALVGLTTVSDACQAAQQGRDPANATVAGLFVVRTGLGPGVALTPGTYSVWNLIGTPPVDAQGNFAWVQGEVFRNGGATPGQAECSVAASSEVVGGTLTVTEVSSSGIRGSANLTLEHGGTLQGSFDAPACALPARIDDSSCEVSGVPATTSCT